jgi:hypothetical protein
MKQEDLVISSSKLSMELLELHPVWGEFDDDDSEMIRPVHTSDPFLADCDPLVIKADFRTTSGTKLVGCVYINRAFDKVYLIEVCIDGQWIGFSANLPDLANEDLARLSDALGVGDTEIFPMEFITNTSWPDGTSVTGQFSPFRD